jgi:hypothetical protein
MQQLPSSVDSAGIDAARQDAVSSLLHTPAQTWCNSVQVFGAVYQSTHMGRYEAQLLRHDGKPHYMRKSRAFGGITHLFYFMKFKQWAIGPNLGQTPVFMYISDTAMTPDEISPLRQWYSWDGHFWQVEPDISIKCEKA